MKIGLGRLRNEWLFIIAAFFFLASPALAQQQQTTPPPSSSQEKPKTDAVPSDQQDKKPEKPKAKSKLEQDTGTVNDRLFEAMPNFVVEYAKVLPPLRMGQKYRLASASVFDYFMYPFAGFLAAMDQANNSPQSWGQGWGAYGKRFGMEFADNGTGTFMTEAIYPSLLREDPRYYQQGSGRFNSRMFHSI